MRIGHYLCGAWTPVLMILCGWLMLRLSRGGMNAFVGYHSGRSMKNADTWRFANAYCGRLWLRTGPVLLVLGTAALFLLRGGSEEALKKAEIWTMLAQLAVLLGTIFPTETALRKTFRKDGTRY